MLTPDASFKIAAVQAAPMFLNREATVEKACRLIVEAASQGARLIVFPESFIPTYPDWVWAVPPGRERILNQLYADFLANAVDVPGGATERLAQAARKAGAYLVMGVTERDIEASGASLYNTLLYFSPEGNLMGKHRKLVPTGGERLVWAQGDGSTLEVYDTPLGKIGGLICWENYMPLARYTMYAWAPRFTSPPPGTTGNHGFPPCGISPKRDGSMSSGAAPPCAAQTSPTGSSTKKNSIPGPGSGSTKVTAPS
jgi:nitrilase